MKLKFIVIKFIVITIKTIGNAGIRPQASGVRDQATGSFEVDAALCFRGAILRPRVLGTTAGERLRVKPAMTARMNKTSCPANWPVIFPLSRLCTGYLNEI